MLEKRNIFPYSGPNGNIFPVPVRNVRTGTERGSRSDADYLNLGCGRKEFFSKIEG
jgi:hypothetical protein